MDNVLTAAAVNVKAPQARTGLLGKATTRDTPGALLDDLNASVNFSRTESMRTWEYLLHILSVTCPATRIAVIRSTPPSAILVMHW
jgi:hypothetical protein